MKKGRDIMSENIKKIPWKDDPSVEVIYRRSPEIGDNNRYKGFKQQTVILKKGDVLREGYMALPCDIIFEQDVAVKMRDGVTIYTDIFRPATDEKVPAIVAWSPYGKNGSGNQNLDIFPGLLGIAADSLSSLQKWEGPDPAYWCANGYALLNPDARGAFMSEGDLEQWGPLDACDGYDFIEWAAQQAWCSGKIGMSGNSWLAVSQWFIASAQPPHLCAIAPWEGQCDMYRYDIVRGGIPNSGFNRDVCTYLAGNNYLESCADMIDEYPLMNSYWESKIPDLKSVITPAYIVASYSSVVHAEGTFRAYREISSEEKWLRIHDGLEWTDYYSEENKADLKKFFDCYLKGLDNGWKDTAPVRLSILDPGGKDRHGIEKQSFPPDGVQMKKYYLDASSGFISAQKPQNHSSKGYISDDGCSSADFVLEFEEDTTFIGYASLHLFAQAKDSDDMDLFVFIQKTDAQGNTLYHRTVKMADPVLAQIYSSMNGMNYSGPQGRQRASLRMEDPDKSTEEIPFLLYTKEEKLTPGEIADIHISLGPIGEVFHKGEKLKLIITGYNLAGSPLPSVEDVVPSNKGEHIVHTGGEYSSYLYLPVYTQN